MSQKITFSFGKNWLSYLKTVSEQQIQSSIENITGWLAKEEISGKHVLDIGSGSGIHSLAFFLLDAVSITSFDYDPASVKATKILWLKHHKPLNWLIHQGSILDEAFLQSLLKYDVVYSWGVLHHTGNMWRAIENASMLVKDDGYLWISIYVKGPNYQKHLQTKKQYNRSSYLGKKIMELEHILGVMLGLLRNHQNPLSWNASRSRGMNIYYDIVDWLGGLPYEVASVDEVKRFCGEHGFKLIKLKKSIEGGCNTFLFQKVAK